MGEITDESGAVIGSTYYRLPDGGIGGAWNADPDSGGPPAADWAPTAGIDRCATDQGWSRAADGTCDPNLRTDCPAGTGPLPGRRCTPTAASDCPSGPFADVSGETTTASKPGPTWAPITAPTSPT